MPALEAVTKQVYVATLLAPVGPVVLVQLVTPVTPVIAHTPIAVGVTALAGPVTVAVKVKVPPSGAVADPSVTETVGVDFATVVVKPEVGAVAK